MSNNADPIAAAWDRFTAGDENRKDAGELTILGGEFLSASPERLKEFLASWKTIEMPYRIWEQISRIEWGHSRIPGFKPQPDDLRYLQRAELFGEGGHLSLRRDGSRWLWSFIGKAAPDLGGFELKPFEEFPDGGFRCYEEYVLLWGERKEGRDCWWDDRVAAADLRYPVEGSPARVRLRYWRFSEGGTTAFVWYRGLEAESNHTRRGGRDG